MVANVFFILFFFVSHLLHIFCTSLACHGWRWAFYGIFPLLCLFICEKKFSARRFVFFHRPSLRHRLGNILSIFISLSHSLISLA
jgi:hypothetical protein